MQLNALITLCSCNAAFCVSGGVDLKTTFDIFDLCAIINALAVIALNLMQKVVVVSVHIQFAKALGKLVKHQRAQSMAQDELAMRTGLSRNTISAIENGKSVSSEALFAVLAHLNLLHLLAEPVSTELALLDTRHQRKARKPKAELSNDF